MSLEWGENQWLFKNAFILDTNTLSFSFVFFSRGINKHVLSVPPPHFDSVNCVITNFPLKTVSPLNPFLLLFPLSSILCETLCTRNCQVVLTSWDACSLIRAEDNDPENEVTCFWNEIAAKAAPYLRRLTYLETELALRWYSSVVFTMPVGPYVSPRHTSSSLQVISCSLSVRCCPNFWPTHRKGWREMLGMYSVGNKAYFWEDVWDEKCYCYSEIWYWGGFGWRIKRLVYPSGK